MNVTVFLFEYHHCGVPTAYNVLHTIIIQISRGTNRYHLDVSRNTQSDSKCLTLKFVRQIQTKLRFKCFSKSNRNVIVR